MADIDGNYVDIGPQTFSGRIANVRGIAVDFSAGAVPVSSMVISTVTVIDPVTVEVTFSEAPLANSELADLDNWSVIGIGGVADRVISAIEVQSTTVFRLTIEEMKTGSTYEVRVCNLQDDSGSLFMSQGVDINQKQFTGTGLAPTSTLVSPSSPASRTNDIVIDIVDAHSGVDISTVMIQVEGSTAFQAGVFQSSFNGPGSSFVAIAGGFRVTIDPESDFAFAQVVDIVVDAEDFAGNPVA